MKVKPSGLASEALVLHDLDPVAVGVEQEGDVLHAAVGEALLPAGVEVLEPLAGGVDVVDRDACVSWFPCQQLYRPVTTA